MTGSPRFSSLVFGITIICFFFPFVTLSCGGQRAVTFSGMQMAIGTTVDEPQVFGPPQKKPIEPNPFASLALLCAVLGATFGFTTISTLAPAIAGGVGGLSLLLAKEHLNDQVLRQGQGVLQVNSEVGYILTVLLFLSIAAWNAYLLSGRDQQKHFAILEHPPVVSRGEPPG
jgi:hypothetical protein